MSQIAGKCSPEADRSSALDVCVRNPITHNTWEQGRYTSYEIAINTSNHAFCLSCSVTRRRYSDFEWLRKRLNVHHPRLKCPRLPPKKYFGDRFDPNFIAFRMKGLETFLCQVLEEKMYMSDALLHLFLQSNLTSSEIDDVMDGRISSDVIDKLWEMDGDKNKLREFRKNKATEDKSNSADLDDRSTCSDNSQESFTDSGSSNTEDEESTSSGDVNFPPITMVTGEIDAMNGQITPVKRVKNLVTECKDSGVSSCDETLTSERREEAEGRLESVKTLSQVTPQDLTMDFGDQEMDKNASLVSNESALDKSLCGSTDDESEKYLSALSDVQTLIAVSLQCDSATEVLAWKDRSGVSDPDNAEDVTLDCSHRFSINNDQQ